MTQNFLKGGLEIRLTSVTKTKNEPLAYVT